MNSRHIFYSRVSRHLKCPSKGTILAIWQSLSFGALNHLEFVTLDIKGSDIAEI